MLMVYVHRLEKSDYLSRLRDFLITGLRTGFTFQEINRWSKKFTTVSKLSYRGKRIDEDELIIERTKRRSVIIYFYGSTVAKKKKKSTKLSYPKISQKKRAIQRSLIRSTLDENRWNNSRTRKLDGAPLLFIPNLHKRHHECAADDPIHG